MALSRIASGGRGCSARSGGILCLYAVRTDMYFFPIKRTRGGQSSRLNLSSHVFGLRNLQSAITI